MQVLRVMERLRKAKSCLICFLSSHCRDLIHRVLQGGQYSIFLGVDGRLNSLGWLLFINLLIFEVYVWPFYLFIEAPSTVLLRDRTDDSLLLEFRGLILRSTEQSLSQLLILLDNGNV